jgi:hypothetical protein
VSQNQQPEDYNITEERQPNINTIYQTLLSSNTEELLHLLLDPSGNTNLETTNTLQNMLNSYQRRR